MMAATSAHKTYSDLNKIISFSKLNILFDSKFKQNFKFKLNFLIINLFAKIKNLSKMALKVPTKRSVP